MPKEPLPNALANANSVFDSIQAIELKKPLVAVETSEPSESLQPKEPESVQSRSDESISRQAVSQPLPIAEGKQIREKRPDTARKLRSVNVYLDAVTKQRMEMAQINIRSYVRGGNVGGVNQSSIVEAALKVAFEQLDIQGEQSPIARELLRSLENKK